ncbi:MAG: hypothetical protein ACLFNQ_12750 [Spirochaetaceae bacterium]
MSMVLFLVRRVFVVSALVAVFTAFTACSFVSGSHDRLLSPRLSLVGAPSRSVVFDFEISASDFETISGSISTAQSTSIVVPAGRDRRIDVVSPSDVYRGSSIFDAVAGRETTVNIPILPGPVFPSPVDERIAQFRDFSVEFSDLTSGSIRRWPLYESVEPDGSVIPTDTVFDSSGRLWIANGAPGDFGVAVLQDLSGDVAGANFEIIESVGDKVVTAIAYDPTLDRIYYAVRDEVDTSLYHVRALASSGAAVDGFELDSPIPHVSGITVDSLSNVYTVGAPSYSIPSLRKYDSTGTLLAGPTPVYTGQQRPGYSVRVPQPSYADITFVNDALLVVAASPSVGEPTVFRFDLELTLIESYGTRTAEDSVDGQLWGPRRFVATRPRGPVIVIDQPDDPDGPLPEGRIVDLNGGNSSGWQAYGRGSFGYFDTTGS